MLNNNSTSLIKGEELHTTQGVRSTVIGGNERPNQAVYRVHDNRVLGRALAFLQPEQRADFLGPIASVCYWHADQWTVTDNPDPGEHPLPLDPAWLKTPTPETVYSNVQFENTRRYLIREHTDALACLATRLNVDDWL
jgi:hypothetical protein